MKKKVVIGTLIVLVIAAFVAVNIAQNSGSSPAFGGGKVYSVKAVEIEKGDISSYISAGGVIEETEKAEVFFQTPLKVKKLFVEENQRVKKGQQIVELDMDSLNSDLRKLEINKSIQELELNSGTMQAEVKKAENALESAQRAYDYSKNNYENSKKLFEANAISKNELETAEKAVTDAETALENAKLAYDTAVSNIQISRQTKKLNLEATELNINDLKEEIKKLNESMYSPIDGVIARLNLEEDQYTSSTQPAYTVINPECLQARAMVNEYNIKYVEAGQNVSITGDAIDDDETVKGKVKSISPIAVNSSTSSGQEVVVEVIISIDKVAGKLKPALNVTCDISTSEKSGVIIAPMDTVMEDKDGNKFVYVIDTEKGIMNKKPVELGVFSDMNVEVLEGLNEGDMAVLNPQAFYKDGSRVRITNGLEK